MLLLLLLFMLLLISLSSMKVSCDRVVIDCRPEQQLSVKDLDGVGLVQTQKVQIIGTISRLLSSFWNCSNHGVAPLSLDGSQPRKNPDSRTISDMDFNATVIDKSGTYAHVDC